MPPTRPSEYPVWASNGTASEIGGAIPAGQTATGWISLQKPPFKYLNRLAYYTYKYLQFFSDLLAVQHLDAGTHYQVTATGAATVAKVQTNADAGDGVYDPQLEVKDSAGVTVWKVTDSGNVVADGHEVILPCDLSPLDFEATTTDNDDTFNRDNPDAQYARFHENGAGAATRYLVSRSFKIPAGATIRYLKMYLNRPTNAGQTITVTLYVKSWTGLTAGGSVGSVSDATTDVGGKSVPSADLATPVLNEVGYYLVVALNNSFPGSADDAIQFTGAIVTWTAV